MENKIKIDSHIPIPPLRSAIFEVISKMKVGDSILTTKAMAISLYQAIRYRGNESIKRKEGEGYRIWKGKRIKDH